MTQKQQVSAAIGIVLAVGDAIRELGSVPSGHLYARLMGSMNMATYDRIIGHLRGAGMVKVENHLITWIGPKKESV